MDQETLASVQKPENLEALINLINYHVIIGTYRSNTLSTRSFRAINGKEINVRVENGEIRVNGAKVIRKDIVGPNGVGYIIDKVFVP